MGTRFHPNGRVKGAGVSCQTLVGLTLRACGVRMSDDEIADGPMDWHTDGSPIETGFDIICADRFDSILGTAVRDGAEGCTAVSHPLMAGDVVGFCVGRSIKHCGIMIDAHMFAHVLRHSKVCILDINDAAWISRLTRAWRAIE